MTFPWKRGDGTMSVTISVKKILDPIIRQLRAESKLSETISELLWLHYGQSDIEAEEAEVALKMKQIEILQNELKEYEKGILSKRESKHLIERKDELSTQIKDFRRIRNKIKFNPNGRWQFDKTVPLNKRELIAAKELIERYGSENAFLEAYLSWELEYEEVSLKIGQNSIKKG